MTICMALLTVPSSGLLANVLLPFIATWDFYDLSLLSFQEGVFPPGDTEMVS